MGVDAARGIAMLGMLGVHLGLGAVGFDWATPESWSDLMNGRSAILFAVLAGVSLSLMTRDLDRADADAVRVARLQLVGRGLTVFVIGLVLELLLTPIAVILAVYGLLFVIAAPLLSWRTRSLVIGAIVVSTVAPLVLGILTTLSADLPLGGGVSFALTGTYPIPVWIAFLLLGLSVGRMSLHRSRTQLVVLALGIGLTAVGYASAALAAVPSTSAASGADAVPTEGPPSDFDFTGLTCQGVKGFIACTDPEHLPGSGSIDVVGSVASHWLDASAHSGGALEIVGSGGLALAILAVMLLVARPLRWLLIPLAALGSMPLTAYSAHVLLLTGGIILGVAPPLTLWIVTSVCLLLFSTVWALTLGRGPLERLTARSARAFSCQDRIPRRRRPRARRTAATEPSAPGSI